MIEKRFERSSTLLSRISVNPFEKEPVTICFSSSLCSVLNYTSSALSESYSSAIWSLSVTLCSVYLKVALTSLGLRNDVFMGLAATCKYMSLVSLMLISLAPPIGFADGQAKELYRRLDYSSLSPFIGLTNFCTIESVLSKFGVWPRRNFFFFESASNLVDES